jgi:hypothetical protein
MVPRRSGTRAPCCASLAASERPRQGAFDTEADLACEMFVLHPDGYAGPSRASPEREDRPRTV